MKMQFRKTGRQFFFITVALAMRRDPVSAHLFRANCLAMNDLAAALCERAQTGN